MSKRDEAQTEEVLFRCPDCGQVVTHLHAHEMHVHPAAVRFRKEKMKRGSLYGGRAYLRFSGWAEWAVKTFKLRDKAQVASLSMPPEGYAGLAIQRTMYVSLLSIVLAIALTLLFSPLALLLLLVPAGFFMSSMYYPSVKGSSRAEAINTELPFLTAYLAMLMSAGIPLFEGLKRLGTEPNPFYASAREAMNLRTDAEYFYKDEELSAEMMATKHPSRSFRAWLSGILHVNRMGGDLIGHLDQGVDEALSDLEDRWNSYTEHANSIGTITAMLYALMPITIYIFLLITVNPSTLAIAVLYTFVVSPLGAVMLIILADSGRPKPPTNYNSYYKLMVASILPGLVVGAVLWAAGIEMYLVFGLAIIVAAIPGTLKYESDWHDEGGIEANLPRLIDDIAENRRIGQDIDAAFGHVAFKHRYGGPLDKIVDRITFNITRFMMSIGSVLSGIKVRSWHSQSIFFLLREATETGGGQVSVFERLARFADRYVAMRRKITSALRGYEMLFYTISIAIVAATLFVTKFVISPQAGLLGTLSASGTQTSMFASSENLGLMQSIAITGAIINSALLGMLSGKISRGTVAGSPSRIIIAVSIAMVATAVINVALGGLSGYFPTGGGYGGG